MSGRATASGCDNRRAKTYACLKGHNVFVMSGILFNDIDGAEIHVSHAFRSAAVIMTPDSGMNSDSRAVYGRRRTSYGSTNFPP